MAVVQANMLLEDQSQIESGSLTFLDSAPYGTFIGVYDGHGGPETWRYVNDNLFHNLKRVAAEQHSVSVNVIRKAFQAMEEGFLSIVAKQWAVKPQLASVGTCCFVGVVCSGTLYVANVGNSCAVLGRGVKATCEVIAIQLSVEHNASIESVRQELHTLHPDDPHIVVLKHNGNAKRLVKAALHEVTKKREMRYSNLKRIEMGVRRHFHDDITVVVLFLDSNLVSKASIKGPTVSMRGRAGNVHCHLSFPMEQIG